MKRLMVAWLVVVAGCSCPSDKFDDSLSPTGDAGSTPVDAGQLDAGKPFDAGHQLDAATTPDAGDEVDAGEELDAGEALDAGQVFDAGSTVVDLFDAGHCSIQWLAPQQELAKSPRADPFAEYLAREGSPEFMVDDVAYTRAVVEWAELKNRVPTASYRPRDLTSVIFTLDTKGYEQIANGTFYEWDCLNWAYRATVTNSSIGYVVDFGPVIDVDQVAQLYLATQRVTSYMPNYLGTFVGCTSGVDTCLARDDDAGTWKWLGYTETPAPNGFCERAFFRMTTEIDAGLTFESLPVDAGTPWQWITDNEYCRQRLWNTMGTAP